MHNKNNSKSQTFIQGLKPFSSSIPKTLKKYLKKGGYNYSNIVENWSKIVGKKISDSCYPIAVKVGKEMKNGTLVLNVIHGQEMEIEYKKNEIIDKINSFFGYNLINKINLKIVQKNDLSNKKIFNEIKKLSEIENKMNEINNKQLKESLNYFLKVYNDRNK